VNQPGRMLIIDREPVWRAFAVEALQERGYAVHLGSDVQTVLREIRDDHFDLIIIDAALLEWLDAPAIEHSCHRLLAVTATPSVPEALGAFRRGAVDYINKAFDVPDLLMSVVAALRKQPVPQ
jgi:DNA-binding response OmpR family regulator